MLLERHVLESLEILKQTNKPMQVAFSGGKYSTALLALFLLSDKLGYELDYEVVHSNTLMEMPFLDNHVNVIRDYCESLGVKFTFLTAPLKDRFLYNVIGRGLCIPNRQFRWCTDRLKIKPMTRHLKLNTIVVNGERLGESKKRDIKLKREGCGNAGECGLEEHSKITSDLVRPLLSWTTCQVWDFIAFMDIEGVLPECFSRLSEIYSINQKEDKSMRTGCIGCPLVTRDRSLDSFIEHNPRYSPLSKVKGIYDTLTQPQHRLIRRNVTGVYRGKVDQNKALGCIKLSSRLVAWVELLDIESQVGQGFLLVPDPAERLSIWEFLFNHTYPRGYSYDNPLVIEDIKEFIRLTKDYNLDQAKLLA